MPEALVGSFPRVTLSAYKFVEIWKAGAAGETGRKMVALTHRGAGTWNIHSANLESPKAGIAHPCQTKRH